MPKAIISNRILFRPNSDEHLKQLIKSLTYKIEEKGKNAVRYKNQLNRVEIIKNYRILPNGVISIPQGRLDLIPSDYEIDDRRVYVEEEFPEPLFPLRDSQQPVYDAINDTCLVNALVGWGKTFTALWLAKKLGQKTLVITHTTALRDQWVEEVEKLYGFTPGIIGSGKFELDCPIVVGNVQTLTKHATVLGKEFGTIALDECMDYETLVDTLEYGKVKLGVLVNNKKPCHVKSLDTLTGETCYKKVLRYFKNKESSALKIHHDGGGSIKCTENHKLFTYIDDNIVPILAQDIDIGMYLLQTTTNHKSTHILNKEWKPIILGLVLGDGSLQYPHSSSSSIRLCIAHGEDQLEYLKWKQQLLHTAEPTSSSTKSGYCDKIVYNISTKSFVDIYDWKDKLYTGRSGSKIKVPNDIASILTKESWAIIFQDDGSSNRGVVTFSVCELDSESVDRLGESLIRLFGVSKYRNYTCNKGHRYLSLNVSDSILFQQQIAHLVHPSMYYKLNKIDTTSITFKFQPPDCSIFNNNFAARKIVKIEPTTLTGGFRYNIEVEDTHTYFANSILVSNCHHVPATTFSTIVDSSYARYRIGLSGTLKRKDGKHILLKDYFGSTVHQPPQSHTINPTIKILNTGIKLVGDNWAQKINNLLYDDEYQAFVAAIAKTQIDKGHKVLVVAERVEFLNKIKEYLGSDCVLITGETDFEQRKALIEKVSTGEASCIAGSRQIFAEGISVNVLSCLLLCSPTSNDTLLEQLIGRIQRLHPDKLDPVVFDLNFSGASEKSQNDARLGFYISKGWKVDKL